MWLAAWWDFVTLLRAIKIAAFCENSPCDFETKTGYATNILGAVSLFTPHKIKYCIATKKRGQHHKYDLPDGTLCNFIYCSCGDRSCTLDRSATSPVWIHVSIRWFPAWSCLPLPVDGWCKFPGRIHLNLASLPPAVWKINAALHEIEWVINFQPPQK